MEPGPPMKRAIPILLLFISALISGCRSYDLGTERGQARFGVEAAQGDLWREARFRFEKVVQMNPDDAENWSNLAVAYEGTGEYELARAAYLRALQIDRTNEYVQRNYSRFIEHYGEAKKPKPDSGETVEEPPPVESADDAAEGSRR